MSKGSGAPLCACGRLPAFSGLWCLPLNVGQERPLLHRAAGSTERTACVRRAFKTGLGTQEALGKCLTNLESAFVLVEGEHGF